MIYVFAIAVFFAVMSSFVLMSRFVQFHASTVSSKSLVTIIDFTAPAYLASISLTVVAVCLYLK